MFKVLIIDDEPIIRKGIRNIVNWDNYDCEVCGEAGDGLAGKKMIESERPDIIITDIRMPEVDGLTMIGEIKEIIPDSKIIILTGYRDFDYAQEAIKLGAFDYILKPTKIEELNAVIARAVKELRFKYNKAAEIQKLRRIYEKNLPFIKEKLLFNMIYGTFSDTDGTIQQAEALGMKIKRFILGIVENDDNGEIKNGSDAEDEKQVQESQLYQFGIISTLEEVFSDRFTVLCVSISRRRVAFVLILKDGDNVEQNFINSKCTYLQNIIQNCFGFTISVAISTQGDGYKQLPEKLKECKEALEHKFYLGANCVIFYSDLGTFFKYTDYSELNDRQKELIDNVKAGNPEASSKSLALLFDCINRLGNSDKDYIKNFYFNTISLINSIRVSLVSGEKPKDEGTLASLYKMIEKCDNISDLNAILENAVNQTVTKVHEYNNNNMKLLLRRAVDFLDKHYMEQITLNQVAEKLYVSNFYLSRMFKKELGINFIDYLNELRINKAKDLLTDTKYKTYEVAEAVGVPNSHYFSKLFRKYTGMTASEYRESAMQKSQK
ncbi:two component transcriptional regulator, AraC family [[Clostridium] cellulosi]|jgi:Response regulator receiver domain./Bacterial regulatory helix-turn-helix proteins, AraC family.|uniref:Stage 0 sporulation protein A homolog n=1 Tax=[Clostridium] cellulosi TaxID=29343 RepID=A0A078KQN3_9FIRM|nr:two component transcriptional regulator, AraC family [[Clostridium] cellulosi]